MSYTIPINEICQLLAEYTAASISVASESKTGLAARWDAILEGPESTFLLEYKSTASTEAVGAAIRQMQLRPSLGRRATRLLVVPFMGEVGKDLCRSAGVSWLDLSGNARITTPGLRIVVEGKPNRFVRRGRPSDPFAPKASRITRILLLHYSGPPYSQSDLVGATGLDKGFVSRILHRLQTAGLVERDPDGFVRVPNPATLLSAWRAAYDFSRHEIVRTVVAARSGHDVLRRVSEGLREEQLRFAATGLPAAWAYAKFASYRLATVYVDSRPDTRTLKRIGASETLAGANLWLVVPNDQGVFESCTTVAEVPCVSPLQAYVDLKGQPERAEEAAEELARLHLPWANA